MLFAELKEFVLFLFNYAQKRLLTLASHFEKLKDILVAILVVKRGKYSQSFLNTSFLFIILTAIVGGPAFAQNNPFSNSLADTSVKQASVISYNPYENNIGTVISAKPRDKIVDYKVVSGDTLES